MVCGQCCEQVQAILNDIAEQNLSKVEDRWSLPRRVDALCTTSIYRPINNCRGSLNISFEHRSIDGAAKVVMVDQLERRLD